MPWDTIDCRTKKNVIVCPAEPIRRWSTTGSLLVAEGLRVQPPEMLLDEIFRRWKRPTGINSDFFRMRDIIDHARGVPCSTRRDRWSDAGEDIRALRKIACDGPLSISPSSVPLVSASLSVAMVKPEDGNLRMKKKGTNNMGPR